MWRTFISAVLLGFLAWSIVGSALPSVLASTSTSSTNALLTPSGQPNIALNPPALSQTQEDTAKRLAFSNNQVQQLIAGKHYRIADIALNGDLKQMPTIKWYPYVILNIENTTQVSVRIDLEANQVLAVERSSIVRLGPKTNNAVATQTGTASPLTATSASSPGYSTDEYTGTTNPIEMYMNTQNGAPTYTPSAGSMDGQVDYLLNAEEKGAVAPYCDPNYASTGYFAQTGFDFPPAGSNGQIVYADTLNYCNSITVPSSSGVSYQAGHYYQFQIHAYDTSPVTWKFIITDQSNGKSFVSGARQGMNSYLIQGNGSGGNTSVWLENWNSPTTTSWYARFSNDIQGFSDYYDGTYKNWPSDKQYDDNCHGAKSYPRTSPPEVMSGSLASGGTVDWSFYNMAQYFNGC